MSGNLPQGSGSQPWFYKDFSLGRVPAESASVPKTFQLLEGSASVMLCMAIAPQLLLGWEMRTDGAAVAETISRVENSCLSESWQAEAGVCEGFFSAV